MLRWRMVENVHYHLSQDHAGDSLLSGSTTLGQNPASSSHMEAVMEMVTDLIARQNANQLVVSDRSAATIIILHLLDCQMPFYYAKGLI